MDEATYNNLLIVNHTALDLDTGNRRFNWLIKPADRAMFLKGHFPKPFYDNGLLHLRRTIRPGSLYTRENRPSGGVDHATLVRCFMTYLRENCLFQEQATLADSGEGIELVDPDGSLAPLLEWLVCPVCMDPCFPPAYVCPNEHNLCGRCRDRLLRARCASASSTTLCPSCRAQTDFPQPYVIKSALVGAFEFKCRYSVYGCKATPSGTRILDHIEKDCGFRPWKCYFCSVIVNATNFVEHTLSVHQVDVPLVMKKPKLAAKFLLDVPLEASSESKRIGITITNTSTDVIKLACLGIKAEGFFFVIQMELQYGHYGWAIAYLGPPVSCRKYIADIILSTEYDVGGERATEFVSDVFLNQPVVSCQEEMRTILEAVKNTKYRNGFAMKDFSRYGGAGRFRAQIGLVIHSTPPNSNLH